MIKYKYLDYFTGFSLALMAAFPVVRETLFFLPSISMVIPVMFLYFAAGLKIFNKGNYTFKWEILGYFYFIILLFTYLFLTGFWNTYDVSVRDDVQKIVYILILLLPIILTFNERATKIFFNWIIVFSVYTTIVYIFTYISTASLRGWGVSAYLVKSMLIGMGVLISISRLIYFNDVNKKRYVFITAFLLFGLAIAIGRASILFTALISFILIFTYYSHNWSKSYSITEYLKNKSVLILIGLGTVLIVFIISQIEKTAAKFIRLFSGAELSGIRVELWNEAFLGFLDSPFIGHGLSSSGVIVTLSYPHNLYLQVMVDGGIIAFILLLIVSLYPLLALLFAYTNNKLRSKIYIPLISSYVFYLLNFSLASNFYEGRVMLSLGLIVVVLLSQEEKNASNVKSRSIFIKSQ